MTGLETAIILVAFVITAAAFAFVVLNMGFLTAEKAQSVISSGMAEASSSLLTDSGMIAQFSNVTGAQSDICLIKLTFYLKLSQGHEPVDISSDKMVITYTSQRTHGEIYTANGTVTTIQGINTDSDTLIEVGEKFKVTIDFNELDGSTLDPSVSGWANLYAHPYEEFRIELRPSLGSVLTIERQIPAVYSTVMTIE
ncbi:MAG: hypothetical protein NWE89_04830 [Candidatus Bathyarchaeota archaeon]|nr:hypothetical protein [Candidatus Bathyarchaeota archaeon]